MACRLWLDIHNVFPLYPEIIQILRNLVLVSIQRGISLQTDVVTVSFVISVKKRKTEIKFHAIFKCTLLKSV